MQWLNQTMRAGASLPVPATPAPPAGNPGALLAEAPDGDVALARRAGAILRSGSGVLLRHAPDGATLDVLIAASPQFR